jgi:histone acetyltransferase (RNA polymerase elongator complex component)
LFYAANTFHQRPPAKRPKQSLGAEKAANEDARVKVIGLTLETRPDCLDAAELRRMRRYGCTRVQVGMQHTDDGVLRHINRGCTRADMVRS